MRKLGKEEIVKKVISVILENEKVISVFPLSNRDREAILELEKEAEKRVIQGLGIGYNQGVRETLTREFVLVLVTNKDFKWPEGPTLRIFWDGKLIGEEVRDERLISEIKAREGDNVFIRGGLIIYKRNMPPPASIVKKPPLVIFPGFPYKLIESVKGVKDAIISFPSPPASQYLEDLAGAKGMQIGTALVGFNIEEK